MLTATKFLKSEDEKEGIVYETCQDTNPNVNNCWAPIASFALNHTSDWWEQTSLEGECGFQFQAFFQI